MQRELRECASCATFVLKSFDIWSHNCGNVLRALLLYTKLAIHEPEPLEGTSRNTVVLNRYDFQFLAAMLLALCLCT